MIAAAAGLGLVIGLTLGALGGGGAVLTVPALVHLLGQDARTATTSSLFIIGTSSLVAAVGHARAGRVRWGVGAAFGATGLVAGVAGSIANQHVDGDVLLLAFAGVVLLAALAMLANTAGPPSDLGGDERPADGRAPGGPAGRVAKVVVAGLTVGFMTGFFGVGGGFVIVPALVLVLGLPMPAAVGTSLVVIAINSAGALLARAGTAEFDWAVVVPFTLAAMVGSLGGKRVADRVSGEALTRVFAVLLIAVGLYTGTTSLLALLG